MMRTEGKHRNIGGKGSNKVSKGKSEKRAGWRKDEEESKKEWKVSRVKHRCKIYISRRSEAVGKVVKIDEGSNGSNEEERSGEKRGEVQDGRQEWRKRRKK